jgi:membrane-associated phospholipid phosphatase
MRFYTIVAAAFTCASQLSAQSVAQQLGHDMKYAAKDIWGVYTAPFNSSGRDWATFAGAIALTGATMVLDKPVERWAQANDSAKALKFLDPLRRRGILFAGKYVVPPAAALYIIGLATNNQRLRDGVIGCAASWAAQSQPRKLFYRLVGRERPDTSPDNNHKWHIPNSTRSDKSGWQLRSMPAGHFANAMGCASFLGNRFDMGVAEPMVYGVAVGVAVGRALDHGHWTSDHVLGGIFGYAVGKEVARRSLKRAMASAPAVTASPNSQGGFTMNFNWTF